MDKCGTVLYDPAPSFFGLLLFYGAVIIVSAAERWPQAVYPHFAAIFLHELQEFHCVVVGLIEAAFYCCWAYLGIFVDS